MVHKRSNPNRIAPLDPVCKKKIYFTQEEALDMVKYINEHRVVREIRPYKCIECGFWHLTSRSS